MTAVTKSLGPAPRAFVIVPLVGAFFIDLSNALIIDRAVTVIIHAVTKFERRWEHRLATNTL